MGMGMGKWRWKWLGLAILFLFLLAGGVCLFYGYARYVVIDQRLSSAQGHLKALLSAGDLETARSELALARADLLVARDEAHPLLFLSPHLGWLPLIGGDVKAAPHLLEMAMALTASGETLLGGLRAGKDALTSTDSVNGSVGPELLASLVAARPTFEQAQKMLDRALEERRAVDSARLSPRLAGLIGDVDGYLPLLRAVVRGSLLAPALLGASGPRTYLILAQNGDELRPTGGFISGVGLLRLEEGRVVGLDFQDSYSVDNRNLPHPPPPEPLTRYMQAGMWVLRDVNWSPDFPTVARAAKELYKLDQGVEVDGVIAVDLTGLRDMLEATGPIELETYGQQVDAANVQALLQHYWAAPLDAAPATDREDSDWWNHRKDFMGELFKAIASHLETKLTVGLLKAWERGLREKHVLIYLSEPTAATLLAENGWDGALQLTAGDYLLVVDANVGFNKVNAHIEQEIEYRIILKEDRSVGQVTLLYRNRSAPRPEGCIQEPLYGDTYRETTEDCYWDYVRLYVPQGSQLVAFEHNLGEAELADVSREGDKGIFAAFFVLPAGQEGRLSFTYELPAAVRPSDEYNLLVQKQPGTVAVPLRVRVEAEGQRSISGLIHGSRQAAAPTIWQESGAVEYRGSLRTDQHLRVTVVEERGGRQWGDWRLWVALGGVILLSGMQVLILLRATGG